MLCPYCGVELEEGVIQSPQELRWQIARRFFTARNDGDTILSARNVWRGSAVRAFHCRSCKKIVIDYLDGECDMNKSRAGDDRFKS